MLLFLDRSIVLHIYQIPSIFVDGTKILKYHILYAEEARNNLHLTSLGTVYAVHCPQLVLTISKTRLTRTDRMKEKKPVVVLWVDE